MPKTYYRLLCKQGTGYMATGYNAESLEQLAAEYASYKSNDWIEEMAELWGKMRIGDKIVEIQNDEFEIESSNMPFDEADIH